VVIVANFGTELERNLAFMDHWEASMQITADGRRVVLTNGTCVRIVDTEKMQIISTMVEPNLSVEINPNGSNTALVSTNDYAVCLDLNTCAELWRPRSAFPGVNDFHFDSLLIFFY
jgi:hypothetical protein